MMVLSAIKRKKLILSILTAVPFVLVICFGCTAASSEKPSQDDEGNVIAAEGGSSSYTEIKRIADWKDVYPEIYDSYMSGRDVLKEEPSKGTDVTLRAHSHATLAETFSLICKQYSPRGPYRTSCLNCHSTDQHRYYEEYGDDAFNMQLGGWDMLYADLRDTGRDVEFWGCYQCHENDPENITRATNIMWNNAKTKTYDFADGDAVCGQCHSIPYTDNVNDLYRYGIDADSIAKAQLEDYNYLMSVCTDVEIFQNSTHQSLGLTCVSCHMPTVTNEQGVTFTSHDASGSPLEKEESLKLCLSCHESQGIKSNAEMISFVEGKQADVAKAQQKLRIELAELEKTIAEMEAGVEADNGVVDNDLLASLQDAYMWADYYLGYTIGGATTDGTLATHNYDQMLSLLSRGSALVKDALASV
jgi:nitrite reductase (cytochrome c-552)